MLYLRLTEIDACHGCIPNLSLLELNIERLSEMWPTFTKISPQDTFYQFTPILFGEPNLSCYLILVAISNNS
jgi:hypothetical protein